MSDMKKALLSSTGPLPSGSAFKACSQDAVRKAFYETQAQRESRWKAPKQEDRGENYLAIHSIGKTNTKYMDFQLSTAPLLDRTATTHSRVNVPLPLGDSEANTALAKSYKSGFASAMKGLDVPQNNRTKYEDDYPELGEKVFAQRIGQANQPSCKPKQELTKTVGGTDTLYEKKSHYHNRFVKPNLQLAKQERSRQPRPGLDLGGSAKGIPGRSAFTREFKSPTAALAARSMLQSTSAPSLEASLMDSITTDPEVFRTIRAPNMMPGK